MLFFSNKKNKLLKANIIKIINVLYKEEIRDVEKAFKYLPLILTK